jgi:hypothetical protein
VLDGSLCRLVAEPQRDLGAQASPSRTRWPDHGVAAQTLADDARTAAPPSAADSMVATSPPASATRMVTPPPVSNAGAQGSVGDIEASTSPWVIDVDTIIGCPVG